MWYHQTDTFFIVFKRFDSNEEDPFCELLFIYLYTIFFRNYYRRKAMESCALMALNNVSMVSPSPICSASTVQKLTCQMKNAFGTSLDSCLYPSDADGGVSRSRRRKRASCDSSAGDLRGLFSWSFFLAAAIIGLIFSKFTDQATSP